MPFLLLAGLMLGEGGQRPCHLGRLLGHDDDEQVLLRVLGLIGLAIPRGTAERARDVLTPLRDLFAALFFLSFGLQTSPTDLAPFLPVALARAGSDQAAGFPGAAGHGRRPRSSGLLSVSVPDGPERDGAGGRWSAA